VTQTNFRGITSQFINELLRSILAGIAAIWPFSLFDADSPGDELSK
jgi:hypothetical protein